MGEKFHKFEVSELEVFLILSKWGEQQITKRNQIKYNLNNNIF